LIFTLLYYEAVKKSVTKTGLIPLRFLLALSDRFRVDPGTESIPVEQQEENQDKEQRRRVFLMGHRPGNPGPQYAYAAAVVKKQQVNQYKKQQTRVVGNIS
jgi:hypothetical protein